MERSRPGRPGRVLLADFGIAKALAETGHLTRTGMLVASLEYASPEQFDNVELDARADEYSLGCTLFHLLTGEFPYPGSTLPQLWAGHVHAPIPKPCQVRPGLLPAFDAVIERAIAKNREDRYPSCGELAAAARAALYAPKPKSQPPLHSPQWSAPTVPDWVPPQPIRRPAERPPRDVVTPDVPPRPVLDPVAQGPTEPSRPPQPFARPPAPGGGADRVFHRLARAGLILLFALIGAALVTRRYYYYGPYYTYQVLDIPGSYPQVALGVLAAVGVVLMLVAVRLRRTRRRTAGRFARAGAALLAFALFTLELADSPVVKNDAMTMVALVGAALLLSGCRRGLSPSKRNVAWLVSSGIVVIVLVIAGHFAGNLWVLGEGFAGWIAGIALMAAGLVLAVRRNRLAKQEQ